MPRKQLGRRCLGTSNGGCVRLRPAYKNHVWSYDFIFDSLEDGRAIKFMPVLDEHTRVCHRIVVARSITSQEVIRELERLFLPHGRPTHLRSDNGPEYTSEAVRGYLRRSGVLKGPHGRRATSRALTARYAMNFSIGNYSLRSTRLRSWPSSSVCATTRTDRTAP